MGKTVSYTKVTPLDSQIPRQLALNLLHSHEEVTRLNPLVTDVKAIETPQNAAADEYFASWYEVTERITFVPGFKKTLKFKQCWYDQAWGAQTHTIMSPLFDLRCSYRIGGNQPGEPREPAELGVNKPTDGLYLREDINIVLLTGIPASFVKKEMQNASATMIARMKRKAELLDDGRLLAIFEDGKLKTTRAGTMNMFDTTSSQVGSANNTPPVPSSATFSSTDAGRYSDLKSAQSLHRHSGQQQYQYENPNSIGGGGAFIAEMSGESKSAFVSELPGSTSFSSQQSSGSRPVSFNGAAQQGPGSRPVSTSGPPQFGMTVINQVPPATN